MARRPRRREEAPRRKKRGPRARPAGRWPAARRSAPRRATDDKGPGGAPGRVVPLTAARRRAAALRRLNRGAAATKPGEARRGSPTADFHLAACIAGARAAGRVIMDYWGKRGTYSIQEKGRNDYVTIVDREAEQAVIRLVRARFPDHAIMAEESAPLPGSGGYRWYIDPLDGTTNFIHGYPLFGVSIGVADTQGMRAAAVYDPLRDEMFTAARGLGAYLNGARIRVSPTERLKDSLLVTGIPFRSLDRLEAYLASFRSFILGASGIRRDGSAALDCAYVACGRFDGFWEMSLSSWDIAAGSLIVREAGGVVTDFQGKDAYLASGDIIAANPAVHPAMLRAVREAFGGY
jgi:myo-inositol-1(or 4)-monophosphatase